MQYCKFLRPDPKGFWKLPAACRREFLPARDAPVIAVQKNNVVDWLCAGENKANGKYQLDLINGMLGIVSSEFSRNRNPRFRYCRDAANFVRRKQHCYDYPNTVDGYATTGKKSN